MRDKFRAFLRTNNVEEEFATQVSEGGIFNDIATLCSKVKEVEEWVSEGFLWSVGHDFRKLDAEWRIECGTKKRFYCKEKGFGV